MANLSCLLSIFLSVLVIIPIQSLYPPSKLRAYAISQKAFRLKWSENSLNPKKSTLYTVRYRPLSGQDGFHYVNTTKGEIKRLNVVTKNGTYEFSVKASRGKKTSDWSDSVQKAQNDKGSELFVRIGPPRGLKVKELTPNVIKIKWRRPKNRKHSISGYRITWKKVGTKHSDVKQTKFRSIAFNGLQPETAYIIKVQAVSSEGVLSQTAKITVRTKRQVTLQVPSNFTVEPYGSTKLLVKWSIPKGQDLTKVTGFQIQYKQKGDQKGTLCTVVTTKKKFKYVITDLYKGQQYKVRLSVKSGHLTGKYTDWMFVKLPGGNKTKHNKGTEENEAEDDNVSFTEDDDLDEETTTQENIDDVKSLDSDNDIMDLFVNKTNYTFEDQNVTLTCIVRFYGDHEVSLLWTKGDDVKFDRIGAWFMEISGRYQLEETTLTDDNMTVHMSKLTILRLTPRDSGGYTCHELGSGLSLSEQLHVTDASPGPPLDIEAEVLSHNAIGVYWSPPVNSGNFPITYEIHCWRERRLHEYDYQHFIVNDIKEEEYIIRSLEYNTNYHIGVIAVNQFGRSNFSYVENVTIATKDLPALEIASIRIINPAVISGESWSQSDNSITTETPLAESENGYIEGPIAVNVTLSWNLDVIRAWPTMWTQHIIHYKTDDNSTVHQKSVWQNSTVINNLEDDKLYYFRVETVFPGNSIYSPWKKFSTYLKELSPPPPPKDMILNVLTNNSLIIKWLPPPSEYRVRVRNYKIVVAEEEGKQLFFRLDKDERQYMIPSIDRSKSHTVELSAINNIGESDTVVRIVEAFSDFSDTVNLYARPLSSRSIRVSWTSASNNELSIYLLRYRPVSTNTSQPVDVFVNPSQSYFIINGLQEHTEYMISLIPYLNDLPGNLTSTTVWTLSDVPSAPPKDVNIKNINVTNFLISWGPPPDYTHNGNLIFYRVEYRTQHDQTSKNMLVPAGKNELLLTGLEVGIIYELRVAAVTVNGTGPFSSWVQLVVSKTETEVIQQPPDPPTNLTAEAIPNGIILSWDPPTNTTIPVKGYIVGHGRFIPEVYRNVIGPNDDQYIVNGLRVSILWTNYIIQSFDAIGTDGSKERCLSFWTRYGCLTRKEPNAKYILTVRSFNSFGESRPALLKAKSGKELYADLTTFVPSTTTPIPGAPYDIRIQEQNQEIPTALITWKRPIVSEHINGYILLYTNNSTLPLYEWTGVFERSLQYVIKNLSFNTTYFVRIQSQLTDGSGVMSQTKYFTTKAIIKSKDTLPKPKIVSAFSGPDYIQVTWLPPDYAYIIRGYTLGYGLREPGEYQEFIPFSDTSVTIKKLTPETLYYFSLRSFGEFGESERAVFTVSTTA